jgi:hypothetical protein
MWKADLSHLNERESTIGGGKQGEGHPPLAIVTEDEQRPIGVEHGGGVVAVGEFAWKAH